MVKSCNMNKVYLSLLFVVFAVASVVAGPISGKHTFEVGDEAFLLDGKPFVIRCGENHPHCFVIDLGKEESVGGFNFTPRKSDGGGRIRGYRAYVLDSVKTK